MSLLEDKVFKIKAYFAGRQLIDVLPEEVIINLKFIDIPAFQISALKNLTLIGLRIEGKDDEFIKRYFNGANWRQLQQNKPT